MTGLRESDLRCDGVIFYADGEAAFQEVSHAHLHVFPRYDGDGFRLIAAWETPPSRPELEAVAWRTGPQRTRHGSLQRIDRWGTLSLGDASFL